METRLERTVRGWTEDWYNQGLEKGRTEGMRRGEVRTLRRLLEACFGALPSAIGARIEEADAATLESWLDRVLDGESLVDVVRG
ncbi:MAG: hypothetical protein AAGC60_07655 [Acidobacteriota bacterium]